MLDNSEKVENIDVNSPLTGKRFIEDNSSIGITMQSELEGRMKTRGVTLDIEGINEVNWMRFMELSGEARQEFLKDTINATITDLLYRNSELLAYYVNRAFAEK